MDPILIDPKETNKETNRCWSLDALEQLTLYIAFNRLFLDALIAEKNIEDIKSIKSKQPDIIISKNIEETFEYMVYKKKEEKRNLMKKKNGSVKKDKSVDEKELEKLQRESDKNAQELILQEEAEKLKAEEEAEKLKQKKKQKN